MPNQITPTLSALRWMIVLASLMILFFEPINMDNESQHFFLWVCFTFLATLTIGNGLVFTNRRLHSAYAVSAMAYLTLGTHSNWGTPLLMVSFGNIIGAITLQVIQRGQAVTNKPSIKTVMREALQMAGQIVIATSAGIGVYQLLDGQVPLRTVGNADILPLSAFIATVLAVYLLLLALVSPRKGNTLSISQMLRNYWMSLTGLLLLPIPFIVAVPYSYYQISDVAVAGVLLVFLFCVVGIYNFNRLLYRSDQQVRELTRLTRFSNAIRLSLDMETLLQTVYLQISQLIGIENFMMVLAEPGSPDLQHLINVQQGRTIPTSNDSQLDELLEEIIEQQKPVLISDNFPDVVKGILDQRVYSWLGVPFAASDRTKGVIVVYTQSPQHRLTNDDRRRLSVIATQVGTVVDNALLFEQSRTRAQQLRDLNNVSTELSGTLDSNAILQSIARAANKVMNADGAAIFHWQDHAKRNLDLYYAVGMSDGFSIMPPKPLLAEIDDEDLIVVRDAQREERVGQLWVTLANEGKRAWIESVLRNGEEKVALLVTYFNELHPITQQDIEIFQTFTSQASLAISNADLYSQKEADLSRRVEQLALLQRLSQALFLSTLKLNEMYDLVLQRATDGTSADTGVLFLTRDESPHCVAQIGYAGVEKAEEALLPLMNEVFRTGEMVLVQDTSINSAFVGRNDIRSQMAIPILYDIQVIGAILLESRRENAFGPEDMFFMMQVGTQARIAIDNVKLIQNIATTRDRLQAILNSMREAIVLISDDGMITLANPTVQSLMHLEPTQLVNRSLHYLMDFPQLEVAQKLGFDPSQLEQQLFLLQTAKWQPRGERTAYDIADSTKRRFLTRIDIPVETEEGRAGWMMVFIDVTEERELAQAREDLSHMIVHDLRGPLTAINMSLKMMENVAKKEETTKLQGMVVKSTETSQRAVRKMLNLVNSILDIGKMEIGSLELQRETIGLYTVASHVLDELSPIAIELEVDLVNAVAVDLPSILIDSEKIERAILNLVDNALKFTPAEGSVTLEGRLIEDNGRFLQVLVKDTGPGVPDHYKETIFDRYVQVKGQKGSRSGTGLGLTFCRMVVEAHGGRIWIEDNPVGGAVFTFTVPLA